MRYEADCLEEMSAPLTDYVRFAIDHKITDKNEGIKDFPICFYRKMGYMEDGKVQMDRVRAEMNLHGSEAITNELFKPCNNIPQEDNEERENAFKVFKCFLESLSSYLKRATARY